MNQIIVQPDILNSVNATHPHPKVSERYQFINTREVLSLLENDGFRVQHISAAKRKGNKGFGAHLVRLHHVDAKPLNVKGSWVLPQLLLANSHDRSMRFGLIAGAFRYACMNGLIFGGTGTNYQLYHVGTASDAALEIAAQAPSLIQRSVEAIQTLSNARLDNVNDRFDFASKAYALRFGQDRISAEVEINARLLLSSYRVVDDQTDLFTVFNRVQEKLINGYRGRIVWDDQANELKSTNARRLTNVRELVRINTELFNLAKEYVR